jgi:hypothetical protein
VVSLNRYPHVMTPTGQFCCKVLDATHILQICCVIIGKQPMDTRNFFYYLHSIR